MHILLKSLFTIFLCLPLWAEDPLFEEDSLDDEAPYEDVILNQDDIPRISEEVAPKPPTGTKSKKSSPTQKPSRNDSARKHFLSAHLQTGSGQEEGSIEFLVSGFKDEAEVDVDWQKLGINSIWGMEVHKSWILGLEGEFQYIRLEMTDFKENAWGYSYGLYGAYALHPQFRIEQTYFVQSKIHTEDSTTSGQGFKMGVNYNNKQGFSLGLHYLYIFNNQAQYKDLESKGYDTQFTGFQLGLGYQLNL